MRKKNSFTDALGKELVTRRLLKKATQPEEKIFEPEDTLPDFTAELIENQPAKKKVKLKKSKKKKSEQKKIADENFEKRVFAEADNDFFDEKQPQNIGDNFRSVIKEKKSRTSTFRSKVLEEPKKSEPEKKPDYDPELYRKLTRAEVAGVGISIAAMLYSFMELDKPLFFLAMSLFTHLMRPLIGGLCGKYNKPVQNALRSFSFVLFFGALLFLFMLSF